MRLSTHTLFSVLIAAFLMLTSAVAIAQKPNQFEDAQQRARDAALIITLLGVSPEVDLPKELIDRAQAVGVFPLVRKESAMFTSFTQGYGVISARTETGWTKPAFYQFSGGGYGSPFAQAETNALVMLFMTKDALSWFEKGGVKLKNEKKAIEGPVGVITDEQRKEIEGAQILAYSYYNGRLSGKSFGKSFWKSFLLNPDNNINTPLYGMKGREVLAGKEIADTQQIPATIPTFTEALQKYYGATKTATSSN
jgi:lipid-binding SYLF domain-containing protein